MPAGSFFGLLGPNGAGKSTLINILAGLVVPSSGEARIWGYDIDRDMRAARRAIGVVPQELNIDPFFTPRESLEVQAGLYGVPKNQRRTDEILAAVGLSRQADSYARTLSGRHAPAAAGGQGDDPLAAGSGARRTHRRGRRGIAPPTMGLRPPAKDSGVTILLTTHYLEEAVELCAQIAIINHGRVIACESTEALLKRLDSKELSVTVGETVEAIPAALECFTVELEAPNRLVFQYAPSSTDSGAILAALSGAGLTIREVDTREAELEDIFLQLTSEPEPAS